MLASTGVYCVHPSRSQALYAASRPLRDVSLQCMSHPLVVAVAPQKALLLIQRLAQWLLRTLQTITVLRRLLAAEMRTRSGQMTKQVSIGSDEVKPVLD